MPEIQPNKTVIDFFEDVAGEYRIFRAGQLAGIRILDRIIFAMESDPEFVNNYEQSINGILDNRNQIKKTVADISTDIDLLRAEIEKEKYNPGQDTRSLAQRLYSVLGHL